MTAHKLAAIVLGLLFLEGETLGQRPQGVVRRDSLYDVVVVGRSVWIVGYPGLILRSNDLGKTFEPYQGIQTRNAYLAVDFGDEQHGIVVGRGGKALITKDGGKTWQERALPSTEPLFDVDMLDSKTAFAVGNFATALRTRDGGETFEQIFLAGEVEDPTLNSVAFIDAKTGVVVGEMGLILRTTDGGITFKRIDDGTLEAHIFGVVSTGSGFLAVGSGGTILLSEDAGASFEKVQSPATDNLIRASFSKGRVVVVGLAGTILWAEDPKGPYHAVSPPPTWQWLSGVCIGPAGKVFATGGRATLLVSDDYGVTWSSWGTQ